MVRRGEIHSATAAAGDAWQTGMGRKATCILAVVINHDMQSGKRIRLWRKVVCRLDRVDPVVDTSNTSPTQHTFVGDAKCTMPLI